MLGGSLCLQDSMRENGPMAILQTQKYHLLTPYVLNLEPNKQSLLWVVSMISDNKFVHIYMHGRCVALVGYLLILKAQDKFFEMYPNRTKIHRHFLMDIILDGIRLLS